MSLTIVIDDREKAPLTFPADVPTRRARLATGDYTLLGYEAQIAIERKRADELYHTCGAGRRVFCDELERLRDIHEWGNRCGYAAVVVEGSLAQMIGLGEAAVGGFGARARAGAGAGAGGGGVGRHVTPAQVVATLAAWSAQYHVPIWFAGSVAHAAELTWQLLRHAERVVMWRRGLEGVGSAGSARDEDGLARIPPPV